MGRVLRRLAVLFRLSRFERDLDEEIEFHRAMKRRELGADGVNEAGGERRALGSVALAREQSREVWMPGGFAQIGQELRYGLRALRRSPGFSAVVIATIAIGIGMSTAVFSVFNAVLLRPLSFQNPDRLVWLGLQSQIPSGAIPATEFVAWREQATSFARLVAYENTQDHTIQTAEAGTQARNAWVSDEFWSLAGVQPALGRLPQPAEPDVIVLSYGFFARWFGGDHSAIGKTARVNGRDITVIGVMPRGFQPHVPQEAIGPSLDRKEIDTYRQYPGFPPQERGRGVLVRVIGELKDGVSAETARAEVETIRDRLELTSPQPFLDTATLTMVPLNERLVGASRRALWILLAAVTCVLLITCANIASLLLARTATRQREIAIRMSLGAGRARVLRHFMIESLVLALLGGVAGLLVARWSIATILTMLPDAVPRLTEAILDGRVLLFAFLASLATALLVGLAPIVSQATVRTHDALKEGTTTAPVRSLRARRLLVTVELALAMVLLTAAGLMVKSFWRMTTHPAGFAPERILTVQVMFAAPDYLDRQRRSTFVEDLLPRLQSLPNVQAASITTGGASPMMPFQIQDAPPQPEQERRPTALLHAVSAGYLRAMGLSLLRGRWVEDAEPEPVVVITEILARREFETDDPIGHQVQLSGPPNQPPVVATIVGVVGDVKHTKLDADPQLEMYIPFRHHPTLLRFTAIVRTPQDPVSLAPAVRTVLADMDRTLPVFQAMTLEQALIDSVAPRRFNSFLLGTFAAAALIATLVGIYGVVSYSVAQRTREIGVRMALGARPFDVVRLVTVQSVRMIAAGIVAGIAGALLITRAMASLLYQVEPTDPQAFAVVTVVMALTALAVSVGPAVKASLLEPVLALRSE